MKLMEVQNELRRLQYKELQAIAKSKAIRANRKKEELVKAISEHMNNQEIEEFLNKSKHEKEVPAPVVKSLLIKRERRSVHNNNNYGTRNALLQRENRLMNNNFNYDRPATPWKIISPCRPLPARSNSPLYSQFVGSGPIPYLQDSDLEEINNGYVPNGTFISEQNNTAYAIGNQPQYHNRWSAINPPLNRGNNSWSSSNLPHKYGNSQFVTHNYFKNPLMEKSNEEEHYGNYLPQVQQQSYETHFLNVKYGMPRYEYNCYKSMRSNFVIPFQNQHHNTYGSPKRLVKPRKTLDQVHQWSDVMISPSDPLIGSYSARNAIKHPSAIEQKQDCFNLGEALKTTNLDVMNFHLEDS